MKAHLLINDLYAVFVDFTLVPKYLYAVQTTQVTVYVNAQYKGTSGVAGVGNYANIAPPVR